MNRKELFIMTLLIMLALIGLTNVMETYINSGLPSNDDITSKITTAMNYDNSVVSTIQNYPNNLLNNFDKELQMQKLRTFKPSVDGPNENPELYRDAKEEFTQMNPINLNL
jgi:hypothetical protein